MHCAEKYLRKVDEIDQKKFREWCQKLLEAHRKTEYRFWAEKIQGFAKEHGFEGWWKWWAPRSPHLVPVICGFGIPKMNMAETGQSKLANANQQCRKLWLSEAATVREERRYVEQVCDIIHTGNVLEKHERAGDINDFVPSVCTKHHAPKNLNVGIQERPKKKMVHSDKKSDRHIIVVDDEVQLVHKSSNSKRGASQKKNPDRHSRGFNPQCQDIPNKHINSNDVPKDIDDKLLGTNNIFLIHLSKSLQDSTKQITRCHGCGRKIKVEEKCAPNNFVFWFRTEQMAPTPGGGPWQMTHEKHNCYFHSNDMGCLRQLYELCNAEKADVYMDNKNFNLLSNENKQVLVERDLWDAIVDARERAKLHGHL